MFFLKELPTRQMIQAYADQYPMDNAGSVESALLMMRQASLLVRQIEAYFSTHNTSQLRFLILIVIDREPEKNSLLVSEISERIDVSRPVMTRTLQSMVDERLIIMKTDDSDARAKQVSLTKKGCRFLESVLPGYFDVICNFMTDLKK